MVYQRVIPLMSLKHFPYKIQVIRHSASCSCHRHRRQCDSSTYDMGEVTKTRRTMIVPNQAIATYVTQWTYDSHNSLLEMIYPDEEKITYSYNLGGQLEKVHGY